MGARRGGGGALVGIGGALVGRGGRPVGSGGALDAFGAGGVVELPEVPRTFSTTCDSSLLELMSANNGRPPSTGGAGGTTPPVFAAGDAFGAFTVGGGGGGGGPELGNGGGAGGIDEGSGGFPDSSVLSNDPIELVELVLKWPSLRGLDGGTLGTLSDSSGI